MKNSLNPRELWDISMIPDNVDISENNLPCAKNKLYGYGKRFNVYYTGKSSCSYLNQPTFEMPYSDAVKSGYTPCSTCY